MKTTEQVLHLLRVAKPTLSARFGINDLALFGSYARNAQSTASDIDILFQPKPDHFIGLAERVALEAYLQQQLGIEKLDLIDQRYLNPVIADDIKDTLIHV